ncbi:MAG TPA: hypothetical protein VK447_17145 [Myxococcaceae bacterium]|nr:hypothetical protein [Myxococcaceae bacterium]
MRFDDDFKKTIPPDWDARLRAVLERARALGSRAVLAFDLDSTLFDNRPRQARIVREYGAARAVAPLLGCVAHHFDSGWDIEAALRNCGLSAEEAGRHYPDVRGFWQERFFTSDYCAEDEAIEGAAAFTHAVVGAGATLCYVTGRHEGMREGTVVAMKKCGLAPPDGGRVVLMMKPHAKVNDDAFKREAHERLGGLGTVVAAFDNEPTHANDYRSRFPDAAVFHLATDHSGRPVALLPGVVSVPHFGITL